MRCRTTSDGALRHLEHHKASSQNADLSGFPCCQRPLADATCFSMCTADVTQQTNTLYGCHTRNECEFYRYRAPQIVASCNEHLTAYIAARSPHSSADQISVSCRAPYLPFAIRPNDRTAHAQKYAAGNVIALRASHSIVGARSPSRPPLPVPSGQRPFAGISTRCY